MITESYKKLAINYLLSMIIAMKYVVGLILLFDLMLYKITITLPF